MATSLEGFKFSPNMTLEGLEAALNSRWLQFNHCMTPNHKDEEDYEFCRNFMDEYFENQGMHFKISMMVALALLFVIGVVGNALVILSIIIFPSMRSRTNIFLLNLAISDLLVFFMCLPFTAYRVLRTRWILGVVICKLPPFLQGVSICVSIGSLASMSIKRYLIIKYPMTAKERMSKRAMSVWIASIWILAALISSPITVAHKITKHQFFWKSYSDFCIEEWTSPTMKTIYTMFLFIMLYLAPLISMAIFYSMLGRTLISTVKFTRQVTNETHQSSMRAISRGRVKVSKIMIALLITFAVCWLPHHVVSIFMDIRQRGSSSEPDANHTATATTAPGTRDSHAGQVNIAMTTAVPIALLLGYANSAINPLCLLLISSKFKKYIRLILKCRCVDDTRATRVRSEQQMHMHSMCSRQQHQQQNREIGEPRNVNLPGANVPEDNADEEQLMEPLVLQNHHAEVIDKIEDDQC